MAQVKNLPVDHNFNIKNGERDKNHVYQDGEYVEVAYQFQEYPKYVGDRIVNSAEEEASLKGDKKK